MENKTQAVPLFKKILKFILGCVPFVLVIVILLGTVLFLKQKILAKQTMIDTMRKNDAQAEKPLTNVVALEMVPRTVTETISLPGVARPWVTLQVVAEVGGKIVEKRVVEGKLVKKGDILAVIDKSDYQNLYDSALASHETALTTEKRLKALGKQQFVTQSQLDDAIARVKTTRAALENAKLNLIRCTIKSPMKGIVDKVFIENGQFMSTGDPVVKVLEIDRLKVEVGIPESDVDAVRKLSTFDMTIDALDQKAYQGSHHYLSKTTGDLARLYTLQIAVKNPGHRIFPGMFARVSIVKHRVEEGLAVPMYSLISENDINGVFVEKDGVATFRPVETGIQDGWNIEIKEGLEPQEHVVVIGHRIIEDGETVNVAQVVQDMEELTR
ncbi:MAG: efflux RND transporter periplasmic adaptor subunit [Desulfobacteraceae bacterium]|nr:MAG: efflux RND transporter periplasmic adaptor subunit [Desulfobacteraceae bacterium]